MKKETILTSHCLETAKNFIFLTQDLLLLKNSPLQSVPASGAPLPTTKSRTPAAKPPSISTLNFLLGQIKCQLLVYKIVVSALPPLNLNSIFSSYLLIVVFASKNVFVFGLYKVFTIYSVILITPHL